MHPVSQTHPVTDGSLEIESVVVRREDDSYKRRVRVLIIALLALLASTSVSLVFLIFSEDPRCDCPIPSGLGAVPFTTNSLRPPPSIAPISPRMPPAPPNTPPPPPSPPRPPHSPLQLLVDASCAPEGTFVCFESAQHGWSAELGAPVAGGCDVSVGEDGHAGAGQCNEPGTRCPAPAARTRDWGACLDWTPLTAASRSAT